MYVSITYIFWTAKHRNCICVTLKKSLGDVSCCFHSLIQRIALTILLTIQIRDYSDRGIKNKKLKRLLFHGKKEECFVTHLFKYKNIFVYNRQESFQSGILTARLTRYYDIVAMLLWCHREYNRN